MKTKYLVPFEDAPAWLSHMEIERDGDAIKFTAVKRSDIILGEFSIPIATLERKIAQMKED